MKEPSKIKRWYMAIQDYISSGCEIQYGKTTRNTESYESQWIREVPLEKVSHGWSKSFIREHISNQDSKLDNLKMIVPPCSSFLTIGKHHFENHRKWCNIQCFTGPQKHKFCLFRLPSHRMCTFPNPSQCHAFNVATYLTYANAMIWCCVPMCTCRNNGWIQRTPQAKMLWAFSHTIKNIQFVKVPYVVVLCSLNFELCISHKYFASTTCHKEIRRWIIMCWQGVILESSIQRSWRWRWWS